MSERIEQIGSATLYLGDCREVLPVVDAPESCITDPVWPNVGRGLLPGWENPHALLIEAAPLLPTSLKRLVVVLRNDSDPRFLSAIPERWPFFAAHWMEYAMPSYVGRKLGGSEIAYAFGDPVAFVCGRQVIPGRSPKAQPTDRPKVGHPCSRALIHMMWLVEWWSDDGEAVLDPFMGSGTTGVACARLGRRFIGIELEPRYFDIACKRIDEAQRQGQLFEHQGAPKPKQEAFPL